MKIEQLKVPFSLGYELGAISKQLEIVIQTSTKKRPNERYQIEAFRIYDSLKFILDELKALNIAENVQSEIISYLEQIGGKNEELEEEKMILGKIKKKIQEHKQRLDRNLKLQECTELEHKLKIWKERITISFTRIFNNID